MRCPSCLFALAVIAAAATVATAAQGAALVSLSRARLPVYFHEGATRGQLEIEIAQKDHGRARPAARYDGFVANVAIEQRKESVTVEEVVIRYVEHLLKEDYEQVTRLYAPGVDAAAAMARARALRDQILGLSQINFLSEWFYEDAKFLLVDFRFERGGSRVIGFAFRNTPQGFLLALDGNDDEDIVLDLLGQVSETIAQGRTRDYRTRSFDHAIALGQGLFGISLRFDGELYEVRQDWAPPDRTAGRGSPRAFAEAVLAQSASLEDKAFARLWCAEDLAGAAGRPGNVLARARREHAAQGRIKHVLTMAFGEDFAHYFVEESDPARLRSIFFGTAGDGFCLTQGPGDRRVRRLLRSEVVADGVWSLWTAQRGS